MRTIRLFFYLVGGMMGLGGPNTPTMSEVEAFLVKHEVNLATAFRLEDVALQEMMAGFTLPRLQIYNGEGVLLTEFAGWGGDRMKSIEENLAVASGHPEMMRLWDDLGRFESFNGVPVSRDEIPQADYYFVEYWATWCLPCKFQMTDLKKFAESREELEIVIITINCDHRDELGATETVSIK